MQTDELRRKFLEDALLDQAVRDCLPMANGKGRRVFKPAPPQTDERATKENRKKIQAFKKELKTELRSLAKDYLNRYVDDPSHARTIRRLANRLSAAHREVLNGDKLYFGVAHKAPNMYLKYLWSADLSARPPHCPFDNGIIGLLKLKAGTEHRWSFCDKASDYCDWVRTARDDATKKGYDPSDRLRLSKWELTEWDRKQNPIRVKKRRSKAKIAVDPFKAAI